ncbi:hypothetical protein L484_000008 [Morus notabilis]|uniref:Uncharacterized protein n=1 Tax=Morus notabilis TaxID=981085 RepID=W9SFJ2_9ROSA|nr:hypothetical protein L484_000008 [Morus notabilis]
MRIESPTLVQSRDITLFVVVMEVGLWALRAFGGVAWVIANMSSMVMLTTLSLVILPTLFLSSSQTTHSMTSKPEWISTRIRVLQNTFCILRTRSTEITIKIAV